MFLSKNDFAQNTKRKLKMMSKFKGGCLEVQGEPGGAAGGLRGSIGSYRESHWAIGFEWFSVD